MMLESPDLNEQFTGFLNLQQGQNEWPNNCGIKNIWSRFFWFGFFFKLYWSFHSLISYVGSWPYELELIYFYLHWWNVTPPPLSTRRNTFFVVSDYSTKYSFKKTNLIRFTGGSGFFHVWKINKEEVKK